MLVFDNETRIYLKPGVTEYVEKSQLLRSALKEEYQIGRQQKRMNFSTFDLAA